MHRMLKHSIDMLTLGQHLQPSRSYLPVQRFVHPDGFAWLAEEGLRKGFSNVASGPLVRSPYHADQEVQGIRLPSLVRACGELDPPVLEASPNPADCRRVVR